MFHSVDSLEQFTEYLLIGKLHPYVKSAPQPPINDGLLTVIVTRCCFSYLHCKTCHSTLVHNSGSCWPIFEILSLLSK